MQESRKLALRNSTFLVSLAAAAALLSSLPNLGNSQTVSPGIPSSGAGSGSVTSVDVSGGSTGLTTTGGPITTAGTITLAGTLAQANGGSGTTNGQWNLTAATLTQTIANDGSTGTTIRRFVKYTSSGAAVVLSTSDTTGGVLGIVSAGAGTTGSATVAIQGIASCDFDGTATVGHYVIASTTSGGKCSDGGATVPASVGVLGFVAAGGSGVGTYTVNLNNLGVMQAVTTNGRAKPGGTSGQVQYNDNGSFNGFTLSQDCTLDVTTGNITCTKTNNVAFGTAATVNTGTSGATIPLLNGNNTLSGTWTLGTTLSSTNSQSGTTYTLAATDCGKTILFTSGSAVTVTTLNSISVGCYINILQGGAGQITIANGSGATSHSAHAYTKTYAQYSMIGLFVDANSDGSAADFIILGDGA